MTKKKNELEFESDKVKAYVQQIQAEKGILAQQLDQLKFDYAELEKRHNDSFEQFKQLKAENEELKKKVESYLCSTNCYKYQQTEKLKQTLVEIKEIVFPKNQLIITDSPIILKIQEKISECEANQ